MNYEDFLESKSIIAPRGGFQIALPALNPLLFDWQKVIVRWAIGKGKCALFEGCGCGKTGQQLEWAHQVCIRTGGDVLILAPLAVAEQTIEEAAKFGISATLCRMQSDVGPGINITNYEMLEHFDTSKFAGVVLDESSCIKAVDGSTRKLLTDCFANTPYRLCATATPSPNDYMELGSHAEFLGVMTRQEMLATFFVHDGGDTSKWRLKGHAEKSFWKWVCSWAVMMQRPSDLGFSDVGYELPALHRHQHVVALETQIAGMLFTPDKLTLTERREVRRNSLDARVAKCVEIIAADNSGDQWLIWCDLNDESKALAAAIDRAVEVTGADPKEFKRRCAIGFANGAIERLTSKSSIFGFGMNFQGCRKMAFVGLSDSFEQIYQATRRCWRFGQKRDVHVHIITSDGDGPVVENIARKEKDFEAMVAGMIEHMKTEMAEELIGSTHHSDEYKRAERSGNGWSVEMGDCVDIAREMPAESVHMAVFSPPFASLYTYSASDRDMGNCKEREFFQHYEFLCKELYRVLKPGRIVATHCMNLPSSKQNDGFIGIKDFRGDIIRTMQKFGFIFHSEICIWKDPVTAMQRTKAIGLLYKQLRKDSTISRQGIPDYLVVFRKPGENLERVTKTHESFPVDLWQRYASPVWMDINPNDTLQRESAREHADERHVCPLQLEVIERAINLWSNPGDTVFSPFAGIGSEGYVAVRNDRQFKGIELKESYFRQACANLAAAETSGKDQQALFEQEAIA